MFQKNSKPPAKSSAGMPKPVASKKDAIPSIITQGMHVLGNVVSEGNVDFDGTLDGNIRCATLTVRQNGCVKGDAVAHEVYVYGKIKGLIRAKHVHLYASCSVEGVIMHESITIEDGAFVDGKFKRTDKIHNDAEDDNDATDFIFDDQTSGETKMLENIRLIR